MASQGGHRTGVLRPLKSLISLNLWVFAPDGRANDNGAIRIPTPITIGASDPEPSSLLLVWTTAGLLSAGADREPLRLPVPRRRIDPRRGCRWRFPEADCASWRGVANRAQSHHPARSTIPVHHHPPRTASEGVPVAPTSVQYSRLVLITSTPELPSRQVFSASISIPRSGWLSVEAIVSAL